MLVGFVHAFHAYTSRTLLVSASTYESLLARRLELPWSMMMHRSPRSNFQIGRVEGGSHTATSTGP